MPGYRTREWALCTNRFAHIIVEMGRHDHYYGSSINYEPAVYYDDGAHATALSYSYDGDSPYYSADYAAQYYYYYYYYYYYSGYYYYSSDFSYSHERLQAQRSAPGSNDKGGNLQVSTGLLLLVVMFVTAACAVLSKRLHRSHTLRRFPRR